MTMNRNERMETLNANGIDTSKYFTFDIPEGLAPNSKVRIMIENGNVKLVGEEVKDEIEQEIYANGYVKNSKLHRRWVTAQTFRMLNNRNGWTEALHGYDYNYTMKMMLEETRVLAILQGSDRETFEERAQFFTPSVVAEVCEDYVIKLNKMLLAKPTKNCKGVPYIKLKGRDIFVEDINKKVIAPIMKDVRVMRFCGNDYVALHNALRRFMRSYIKLDCNTPKSSAWVDAFKGNGALYAMKNLFAFHSCFVKTDEGVKLYGADAIALLNIKANEYRGEWWRLHALLKKVIADNNFDFNKVMAEKYNR